MKAKRSSGARVDRRHARILAMQALCQLDAQGDAFLPHVAHWLAESGHSQATISCAQQMVDVAWGMRAVAGAEIDRVAAQWTVERMGAVDRNVIRVALAEFDLKTAPARVILNEAVEIAGEYGGAESGRFVNGVLDALWKAQQCD